MLPKYIFFHTARAAVFEFYAFVVLFVSLFYARLTLDISETNLIAGTLLYIGIVVFYAIHIDRSNRGNRGL